MRPEVTSDKESADNTANDTTRRGLLFHIPECEWAGKLLETESKSSLDIVGGATPNLATGEKDLPEYRDYPSNPGVPQMIFRY